MRILMIAAFAASLAVAAPAGAQDRSPLREEPLAERILRQATEVLLKTLAGIVAAIPQYEAPEITEDGDIIIRRKRPPDPQPSPDPGEVIPL